MLFEKTKRKEKTHQYWIATLTTTPFLRVSVNRNKILIFPCVTQIFPYKRPIFSNNLSTSRIILDWKKVNIEYSEGCTADYILVMDTNDDQEISKKNGMEKICGNYTETNATE